MNLVQCQTATGTFNHLFPSSQLLSSFVYLLTGLGTAGLAARREQRQLTWGATQTHHQPWSIARHGRPTGRAQVMEMNEEKERQEEKKSRTVFS